jgi:hypothetical protein
LTRRQQVEDGADETSGRAIGLAGDGAAERISGDAVLKSDGDANRSVARNRGHLRGFGGIDENLGEVTVDEPTDANNEALTLELQLMKFMRAAIGEGRSNHQSAPAHSK